MIECPECEGMGGWNDMDGRYIECEKCAGRGQIEDEEEDE